MSSTELPEETVRTPVRSPRANVIADRVLGTLCRARVAPLIPLDERHPRTVFAAHVDDDNTGRPHGTLRLETPVPAARSPTGAGAVTGQPVLGTCQGG
jgi:hypothetical protein